MAIVPEHGGAGGGAGMFIWARLPGVCCPWRPRVADRCGCRPGLGLAGIQQAALQGEQQGKGGPDEHHGDDEQHTEGAVSDQVVRPLARLMKVAVKAVVKCRACGASGRRSSAGPSRTRPQGDQGVGEIGRRSGRDPDGEEAGLQDQHDGERDRHPARPRREAMVICYLLIASSAVRVHPETSKRSDPVPAST